MDVWELIAAIKAGRRGELVDALARGFDPNAVCKYTNMSVLLGACEADDLEAVRILLDAGADPNHLHNDNYDAYHSTKSRAVRELLLARGFTLVCGGTGGGRGLWVQRVFMFWALTRTWNGTMDGPTVCVEYCRSTFPPTSGDVIVRLGADVRFVVGGDHVTLPAAAGPIEATIDAVDFVGELQIRVWDEQTIAGNQGDRAFWLPPWSAA